ncbi:DNA polymerase L [Peptoclostridium acidaminophilum DSM 3953]|uniref:DNA-directed DNA polymerase n=1 Tax=Peptoclostridium acidaminophilum DSM 3953 TaxID=1286171 RepID=W8T699_PEPAC|nr:DNA polymerase L [Peptoclostridium acidaminophilum DSM 3953]
MKVLSIDIETYSSVDLAKCGVYPYVESGDFEILIFGYAFGDEDANVADLARGEEIPQDVQKAMTDPAVIKTAFNANFERTCLSRHFKREMPPSQWRCSQVHALTLGLPGHLSAVAKVMGLKEQKMKEGKALIRYFSMPCKGGARSRNLPEHDMERWETFKEYCKKDVEVEREIRRKLQAFPVTENEQELWQLDQRINDIGIRVDKDLVEHAIRCDELHQEKLLKQARCLTGLENPNSPAQLKGYLRDKHKIQIESLSKKAVEDLLEETRDDQARRLLELRQEMSKTSVKKYEAMDRAMRKDHRIGGLLQFYGANRTGRWAGRLVQIQNLPRNAMKDLDLARDILKSGDYELLELLFDSVPDVLSQLVRTAFVPSPGARIIVSDFSAIEARVIAWLAGEQWVIDTFRGHGKIYEMTASRMFSVPIEKIAKGNPEYELRAKGKIATLACGYQGGVGALKAMGAERMGLSEDELSLIVSAWRKANPNIVRLWRDAEEAAVKAIKGKTSVSLQHGLKFLYKSGMLLIRLPSGRSLAYARPRIEADMRFGRDKITFEGLDQTSKSWGRIDTYGGKIAENLTQAIARDCLAEAMLRLDRAGYKIVAHIHDEVVLDVPKGEGSLDEVNEIMSYPIGWASGLPLSADGFESEYYKKD